MKNYIVEKQMTNSTSGYYLVVVEGEDHLNRTVIKSKLQFFTTEGGYDYCHPWQRAKSIAEAIANGLNLREEQRQRNEEERRRKIEETSPLAFRFKADSKVKVTTICKPCSGESLFTEANSENIT